MRSARRLPPLIVAAIITAYWSASWRAGLGKADFPGHVGLLASFGAQLKNAGLVPLWTADWNAGSSLVFWYLHPLNSAYLLFPFVETWGGVDGIRIGDTFFLALAGLSMYGFGAYLTGSRAAASIGALVYVLHPSVASFVGEVGQVHQPISMAALPLLFWAWSRLGRQPDWQSGLFAVVSSALLFYDMERFWLTAPHAFAVYLAVAISQHHKRPPAARALRVLLPALAVGAGMTLLVAFPTLPAFFERPLLQWHDVSTIEVFRRYYSFPHLLALVDRDGVLAAPLAPLIPQEFVSLPGQWYQGAVALAYVTIGSFLVRRDAGDRTTRDALGLTLLLFLVALLIAFGVYAVGPKHWMLFGGLLDQPIGVGFGSQLLFFALGVGVFLAAVVRALYISLLDRWPAKPGVCLGLTLATIGLFLFAKPFVLLSQFVFLYAHLRAPSHFAFPALPFLLGTAACLVTPAWMRLAGGRWGVVLATLVVVLHWIDVSPYRFQDDWTHKQEDVDAWSAAYRTLDAREPGRMLDTHHYNPVADMLGATVSDRRMAWSWLSWSSTREVADLIKTGFFDSLRIARLREDVRDANTRTAAELSALANVRFVTRIAGISPPMPASPLFERVFGDRHIEVYENKLALPYVQFYPELALLSGAPGEVIPRVGVLAQRGIASLALPPDAPASGLKIDHWAGELARSRAPISAREISQALTRPALTPSQMAAPCAITHRRADAISLDCDFARAGTLVVAEAWFPNWNVVQAGERKPALRLNHAFQGTQVAAGPRRIDFVHEPSLATRMAKPLSAVAWIAAFGLGLFAARASRNQS